MLEAAETYFIIYCCLYVSSTMCDNMFICYLNEHSTYFERDTRFFYIEKIFLLLQGWYTICASRILEVLNKTRRTLIDKHAPLKHTWITTRPHPWYNNDIHQAKLHRRSCERKWRVNKCLSSRNNYVNARTYVTKLIKVHKITYRCPSGISTGSFVVFSICSASGWYYPRA